MRVSKFALSALTLALAIAAASYVLRLHAEKELAANIANPVVRPVAPTPPPQEQVTRLQVQRGKSFGELLQNAGFDANTAQEIIQAARPLVNFHRFRENQELVLTRSGDGKFESLRYRPDPGGEISIIPTENGFAASRKEIPVTTETVAVAGTVQTSLFDAVIAAGESPELAVRLAEIFAWDLDFYTDPRPGDTFRLVFERKKYDGVSALTYGQIFAAEYDNAGHPYQAVLFHDHAGRLGYYAADGKSLQKAFLRSPLKFAARISSHYSLHRFHPVLKLYRAHLGTDYAAPVGTPVQAVAHGRVEFAGRLGGDGNMVRLKHSNGYETYYLHLSSILVHRGQSVQQGQLVGRVGATGLATGPHLDFRVRQGGRFINFEHMKLPPSNPVPRADLAEFHAVRDQWMPQLLAAAPASAGPVSTTVRNQGSP